MTLTFKPTIREPRIPLRLRLTFIAAIIYSLVTSIATIGTLFALFAGGIVSVAVPVAQYWPKLYPSVHIDQGPTAKVAGGGFTLAQLSVSGLGLDAKLWYGAGYLVQGLTFVFLGLAVIILCTRLFKQRPFEATLTRAFSGAAGAILVGGLAWQICFGVAGAIASQQLLTVTAWQMTDRDVASNDNLADLGWPGAGVNWSVDFWPIWVSLALFAIAACFRYGEKLQRERATLDRERTALRRDTEGLV